MFLEARWPDKFSWAWHVVLMSRRHLGVWVVVMPRSHRAPFPPWALSLPIFILVCCMATCVYPQKVFQQKHTETCPELSYLRIPFCCLPLSNNNNNDNNKDRWVEKDYYHLYSPKSVNFVTLSLDFRSFKEVQEQPDSVPLRKSFVSFLDSRSIFLCTWNLKASPGWGLVPVSCGDVVRGRDPHVSSTRRSQMSVGTATVPLLLSSFSRSMFWICQSLHLHSLPSTALSLRSLCFFFWILGRASQLLPPLTDVACAAPVSSLTPLRTCGAPFLIAPLILICSGLYDFKEAMSSDFLLSRKSF